jgi:hypothetical protein
LRSAGVVAKERIVAVGLLTQREVELLGHNFSRLWPIDDTPCFADLLKAIDEADRELQQKQRVIEPAQGQAR